MIGLRKIILLLTYTDLQGLLQTCTNLLSIACTKKMCKLLLVDNESFRRIYNNNQLFLNKETDLHVLSQSCPDLHET